jgi:hypothetical protein
LTASRLVQSQQDQTDSAAGGHNPAADESIGHGSPLPNFRVLRYALSSHCRSPVQSIRSQIDDSEVVGDSISGSLLAGVVPSPAASRIGPTFANRLTLKGQSGRIAGGNVR